MKGVFADNSYFYRWIRDRIKNTAGMYSLAIMAGLADPPEASDESVPIPLDFEIYRRAHGPEIDKAWLVTDALFERLRQKAQSAGSELLVFHAPIQSTIYSEEWSRMAKNYGFSQEEWSAEQASMELERRLRRLGIPSVDPIPSMRERAKELQKDGERLYFRFDGHWNRNGNRLAGELLADYIGESYLGATAR